MSDRQLMKISIIVGIILSLSLIANTALTTYLIYSDNFKASIAETGESVNIALSTDTGRLSPLGMLWRQIKTWVTTWYVGGAEKTLATTGITVSVTGSNVASQASVTYYIEAKDSLEAGSPYRFLEGTDEAITVGGAPLDLENQTTIESHLEAMGLSTDESHTIDYYVYVYVEATGAISGETLTTEIPYTKFDTVSYSYGSEVTDNYQVSDSIYDGFVYESGSYYDRTATAQNAGDYSDTLYDWGSYQCFTHILLAQGTEIVSAHLKWAFRYRTGTPNLVIYGEDKDDPGYCNSWAMWAIRDLTENSTDWNPTQSYPSHTFFSSPDIGPIIQELVDRPGWESDNNMQLYVQDKAAGWSYSSENRLGGYTYDQGGADAPKLEITYMSYSASWYTIPPLSVINLPIGMDVAAVLSAIIAAVVVVRMKREERRK